MKPVYWVAAAFILMIILVCGIIFPISCSKPVSQYAYEEMSLIDQENSNKTKDMYSFDKWQVDEIKNVMYAIPSLAEITYVDTKHFVYFILSNKVFAIKQISIAANSIIIYDLGEVKKRR